jgi:phosphate-selective porin OprO/OprP
MWAATTTAQQPTMEQMAAKISALEANLRQARSRIQNLESKVGNQDLAAEFQQKLDRLRDELKAEMAAGGVAPGGLDFRVYWSDGIRMDTANKLVKLKIGGLMQYDLAYFNQLGTDRVEARRLRIYFAGTMGKHCEFKLEFDLAEGDADLMDAYFQFSNIPFVGNIRIGHFKEPFSLETLTSSRHLSFLERALPVGAFSPARNWGVMLHRTLLDERMTIAAGLFREADSYGYVSDEESYRATARITGLPVYANNGRRLVHLGAAMSYQSRGLASTAGYMSTPENHLGINWVGTGAIPSDSVTLFGAEVAAVIGPFSVQGEFISSHLNVREVGDLSFSGFYVFVSYFLTGEHRRYDKASGVFTRVKPKRPFCNGEGPGAWEVLCRISYVDMNDDNYIVEPIAGGILKDITAGVNWYLNNNVKMQWNYICVRGHWPGTDEETQHILAMRVQVDF